MKKTFRLSDSRPDAKGDARDEVGFHLEMRTREFITQGMSQEDARRAARASFGDVDEIESEIRRSGQERSQRHSRREWWSSVGRDVVVALRSFRRRPLYAISTIAALALGIGAAGSVFAVVDGVLLKPLPYDRPDRLAMVWLEAPPEMGRDRWPLSAGFFDLIRQKNRSFSAIAAFRSWPLALGDFDEVEQVRGARVVPSLFTVLGVKPYLGRNFNESEGVEGGPRVAILSYNLWKSRYGSDPAVVGRVITLSGDRFEVVGVMPPEFGFPRGAELMRGLAFGPRTDLWIPLTFSGKELQNYGTQNLAAVGRLRDGITPPMAHDDVGSIVTEFLRTAGISMAIGNQVVTLKDQAAQPVQRGLWLLLGAVVAVLLIACANVAGLLSARVAERQREFAVRLALGARQPRVARQLLTETLVLAVAGGTIGTGLTYWGTKLLLGLAPIDLPRSDDIGFGLAVGVAIGVVSLLSGLAFGFIATRGLTITAPAQALSAGSARTTGTRGARLGRRVLVGGQIALSVLLLIGAGLLLRSFAQIQGVSPGFVAERALTGEVVLPLPGRPDPIRDGASWVRFFEQYLNQVSQIPGVVAAGAVSGLPLTGTSEGSSFAVVGKEPPRREDWPRTAYLVSAGDYFKAAGIEMLAGRNFDPTDRADSRPVAIITKTFAARAFGAESPIGRQVHFGFEFNPNTGPREIVGVVDDVKLGSLDSDSEPTVYVPESQMSYPGLSLVVRTEGAPESILPSLRRELKQVNPAVAISSVRTLEAVLRASLARQRFMLTLLGSFAGAALLLAVLGLYGVIAISVQARRRELGVRLALGAKPGSLVRLVVADGMRLVAMGAGVGLATAFLIAGTLRALLFGVGSRDLGVYLTSTAIVILVALAATYIPARAAVRGNPTEALLPD